MMTELVLACRRLRRVPLFAIAVVLSLGSGIALTATVFTWVNGLLLSPMPGAHQVADLSIVTATDERGSLHPFSYPDFEDLRSSATATALAAYDMLPVTVGGVGEPERQWAVFASDNFFDVLQVRPAGGTLWSGVDDRSLRTARPVAVVSYDYWRRRLSGRELGRTITVNRQALTVIGVTPPEFGGPYTGLSVPIYIPLSMRDVIGTGEPRLPNRTMGWLGLIGRTGGSSRSQGTAELNAVAGRLSATASTNLRGARVVLSPLWQSPVGAQSVMGPVVLALMVVVLLVLAIACLNVAALIAARVTTQLRQLAVRLALGAPKGALIRFLLAETSVLAVVAGGLGLLFARVVGSWLQAGLPDIGVPLALAFPIDWHVWTFVALLAGGCAVLCSVLPVVYVLRMNPVDKLKDAGAVLSGGRSRQRTQRIFLVVQLACTFCLVASTGLLIRSVRNASQLDLGFLAHDVTVASLDLTAVRLDPIQGASTLGQLLEELRANPIVRHAALARSVPLGFLGQDRVRFTFDGSEQRPETMPRAPVNYISDDYFRTMGVALRSGRDFTTHDDPGRPKVAIVNAALARQYFNGEMATGRVVRIGDAPVEIVGEVNDFRFDSLTEDSPCMFLPVAQWYRPMTAIHIASVASRAEILRAIGDATARLDGSALFGVARLQDAVDGALLPLRVAGVVLTVLALFGGILTTVGVYAATSQAVGQRTREIALRIMLGAPTSSIRGLVLRHTASIGCWALVLGFGLFAAVAFVLSGLLINTSPTDAVVLLVSVASVGAVLVLASAVPVRRAVHVNPIDALREG